MVAISISNFINFFLGAFLAYLVIAFILKAEDISNPFSQLNETLSSISLYSPVPNNSGINLLGIRHLLLKYWNSENWYIINLILCIFLILLRTCLNKYNHFAEMAPNIKKRIQLMDDFIKNLSCLTDYQNKVNMSFKTKSRNVRNARIINRLLSEIKEVYGRF